MRVTRWMLTATLVLGLPLFCGCGSNNDTQGDLGDGASGDGTGGDGGDDTGTTFEVGSGCATSAECDGGVCVGGVCCPSAASACGATC